MVRTMIAGAQLEFASLDEARRRIATSDEYTKQLSPYELQAKIQRLGDLTEGDYLANAARYVRAWAKNEVDYIGWLAEITQKRLEELDISFALPKQIWLVKTTGGEEGGANGYTRSDNIFLNQSSLSLDLFRHELFHVATRFDTNLRDACYRTVGFEAIGPVDYIDANRISNPDAPVLGHAVDVMYRGQMRRVAIVLSGNRPYAGGSFFSYVSKRLLSVDDVAGELLDFSQVADMYKRIGRNTSYNIHQEEICASHFELLLSGNRSIPQPELIDDLKAAMAAPDKGSVR